jgi:predicted Co/Zn/Cd cation transporter (cation efflux family)
MATPATDANDPARLEARSLWLSSAAGLVLAILALVWGVVAESQVILFDGVYASLGFVLSWFGLRAAALVQAGPTPRYPFGREALAPLVVAVQALVLLGTFGYAAIDAVLVIAAGGSETAIGSAFAYSIVTLVAVLVLWIVLRRRQAVSDLVAAEVTQWGASVVVGVAMVVGFGAAVAIRSTSYAWFRAYVDPTLVLVAAALILPTPVLMLRHAFRELLEGVPDPEVSAPIEAAVAGVRADLGLPQPNTRIGKLGRKVYVELDFVVGEDDGWSVADADRIRRRLMGELDLPGQLLWLNVELHTDPAWDG